MAGQLILSLGAFSNIASREGQDPYFQPDEGGSLSYLPPVYVFTDYSVAVNAAVIDDREVPKTFVVNSVSVSNDFSQLTLFEYTTTTNSFSFITGADSPFNDYFEFMYYNESGEYDYRDDWAPQEAIDNGFLNLTTWHHPTDTQYTVTHTISVTATTTDGTETFSGSTTLRQTLYFRYPPFTQYVINLSGISQEYNAEIIGPMTNVLTGDEYTYYVDDNGDIQEYFIADQVYDDIAIGDTYIVVNNEKVKFDPPDYLGNGADFTKNGTDYETPKQLLTELGLYPPAEE